MTIMLRTDARPATPTPLLFHSSSGPSSEPPVPIEVTLLNLCRACGLDFGSVQAFDRHRVGVHEYTYSEGVAMDPIREDGRRCLSLAEIESMRERDGSVTFQVNAKGRWSLARSIAYGKRRREEREMVGS